MRRRTALLAIMVVVLAMGVAVPVSAGDAEHRRHRGHHPRSGPPVAGLVVTESRRGFTETYDALLAALEGNPAISVVAEVDHKANARSVGRHLPPTREVFFGNPNLGTPLMQADQVAGIDLPQKMLVWRERGRVFVAYNAVAYLAARHDVEGVATLDTIAGALANLTSVATGVDVDDIGTAPGRRARALLRRIDRRPGLRSIESEFSVDETVERLTAAIADAPPSVVFTLDHQANAADVGLRLRPTTLVVFGNPNLGTPLMRQRRTIGIDLPQKLLVHEDAAGDVFITWNAPRYIARRHHVRGERDTLRTIATALRTLATAAAGR